MEYQLHITENGKTRLAYVNAYDNALALNYGVKECNIRTGAKVIVGELCFDPTRGQFHARSITYQHVANHDGYAEWRIPGVAGREYTTNCPEN